MAMKKLKFFQIKHKIVNNPGFRTLKEIKEAGYRIVKERDGDRYFLARKEDLKPLLVRLKDVAEVKRGITTGANEFFYLPSKHFDIKKDGKYYELIPKHEGLPRGIRIEEKYLSLSVLSPKELNSIYIKPNKRKRYLLLLSKKDKLSEELKTYLKWGEKQRFNKRPTCKSREKWWAISERPSAQLACNYQVNDYMRFYYCPTGIWFSDNFQEIHTSKNLIALCIYLNSIVCQFFVNMVGRSNFGGGLLKIQTYEVSDLLTLNTSVINLNKKYLEDILLSLSDKCNVSLYEQCGINPTRPIREQPPNPLPDRKALDDIVFDILGLTEEVYWAVCEFG